MANRYLSVLQQMKEKGIVDAKTYVELLNEAKEKPPHPEVAFSFHVLLSLEDSR